MSSQIRAPVAGGRGSASIGDLASAFRLYAPAEGAERPLSVVPRLASWMGIDHPDQIRLGAFLDHAEAVLAPDLSVVKPPLAVSYRVTVPVERERFGGGDLDNYAYPVAKRLGWERIHSFRVSKFRAGDSTLTIGPAVAASVAEVADWEFVFARGTASASSKEWKEQLNEQIGARAQAVADGPVELAISYRVDPRRNWIDLWKPSIDALDPILGRTHPNRPFHPRDERILRLALHRWIDPSVGWAVELGIWWRSMVT